MAEKEELKLLRELVKELDELEFLEDAKSRLECDQLEFAKVVALIKQYHNNERDKHECPSKA
jgi:hypothetical protein